MPILKANAAQVHVCFLPSDPKAMRERRGGGGRGLGGGGGPWESWG